MTGTCICQELYGRLTIDGEEMDLSTPHGLAQFIMHQIISMHRDTGEPVVWKAIQSVVAPLHRLEVMAHLKSRTGTLDLEAGLGVGVGCTGEPPGNLLVHSNGRVYRYMREARP